MTGNRNPETFYVSGGMSGLGQALAMEYVQRGANIAIYAQRSTFDAL